MSKPFEEVKRKHLDLLRREESGIIADEVRQFVKECRKAGRDISDSDERDYVRANILRYWRNFLYSKTDTYPDIELDPPLVADLYKKAIECEKAEEWEEAKQMFLTILKIDPEYRDVPTRLARVTERGTLKQLYDQALDLLVYGRWQDAVTMLKEIVARDPNYKDTVDQLEEAEKHAQLEDLYIQGTSYLSKGEWRKAIAVFEEINRVDPDYYKDTFSKLREARRQAERMLKEAREFQEGEILAPVSGLGPLSKIRKWWQAQSDTVKVTVIGAAATLLVALCGFLGGDTTLEIARYLLGMNPTSTPMVSAPTAISTSTLTPTSFSTPTGTPYPAPALVSPDEGASFAKGHDVKLHWEWKQDLAKNEFFEVRIRLKGEQEFDQMDLISTFG